MCVLLTSCGSCTRRRWARRSGTRAAHRDATTPSPRPKTPARPAPAPQKPASRSLLSSLALVRLANGESLWFDGSEGEAKVSYLYPRRTIVDYSANNNNAGMKTVRMEFLMMQAGSFTSPGIRYTIDAKNPACRPSLTLGVFEAGRELTTSHVGQETCSGPLLRPFF